MLIALMHFGNNANYERTFLNWPNTVIGEKWNHDSDEGYSMRSPRDSE